MSGHDRKIGLYGGTFDPIHNGHIHLALSLMEAWSLDELYFCPARCSPNKKDKEQTPAEYRLAMVELAVEAIPGVGVYDGELRREGLSYTIDTLESMLAALKQQEASAELHLLMGADSARTLHSWHRVSEIVGLVPLIVGSRDRELDVDDPKAPAAVREAIRKGLTPTPFLDISASELRERLKENLYCGHLIHHKVLDYINKNGLYSSV